VLPHFVLLLGFAVSQNGSSDVVNAMLSILVYLTLFGVHVYMYEVYCAMITQATALVYAGERVTWPSCLSVAFRSAGRLCW